MSLLIDRKRTVDWLLGTLIGGVIGTIFLLLVLRFYGSIIWLVTNIVTSVCIIAIALFADRLKGNKLKTLHFQSVLSVTAFTLGIWALLAYTVPFLSAIIVIIIGGSASVFITEFLMKRTKRAIEGSSNK